MPTYEYVCTKCDHTFDALQSIKDKALTRCPKCNGALRRVINGGLGIIFKGSGFYTTDYKKGSALTGGNGSSKEKERDNSGEKSSQKVKSPEKPKEMAGDKTSEKK